MVRLAPWSETGYCYELVQTFWPVLQLARSYAQLTSTSLVSHCAKIPLGLAPGLRLFGGNGHVLCALPRRPQYESSRTQSDSSICACDTQVSEETTRTGLPSHLDSIRSSLVDSIALDGKPMFERSKPITCEICCETSPTDAAILSARPLEQAVLLLRETWPKGSETSVTFLYSVNMPSPSLSFDLAAYHGPSETI
jgi:hypothetical protein